MALTIHVFPVATLTPKHPGFWPSGGVKKGPSTISDLQDFDALNGGPIWKARLSQIPVYCRRRILLAQAIQSLAMSGVGLFDVARYPSERAPGHGEGVHESLTPHSDLTPFSDQTYYASGGYPAVTVAGWTLTDSIVTIQFAAEAPDIIGGEEFSVRVEGIGSRMHRIMRILSSDAGALEVEISPPLRSDVPAGAEVDFTTPSCVMRMTNPEAFMQELTFNRYADLTAEFEEAFF